VTNRHTHRQTDHATQSVATACVLCSECMTSGPTIVIIIIIIIIISDMHALSTLKTTTIIIIKIALTKNTRSRIDM